MTMINNKSEIINKLFFDELKELIDKYNNIDDETITVIERIDNGNTINVKVRVYLWDSSYPTDVTYIYENGKWVINSELEDWGTG